MEGSFLPPGTSVLQQKTNRKNHIAQKLLSSWTSHPPISNPLNCGWDLSNGHWKVKWFEGDTAPTSVELITADDQIQLVMTKMVKSVFNFFVG